MFAKSGIQVRLLFAAFVLLVGMAFTLQLAGVRITREFMESRFFDRISFLAKYLALNAEVGVLINDRDGLNSLALNLLGEEDVSQVTILDNQNEKLVDISRPVPGPVSIVETSVVFKKAGDENILFTGGVVNPFRVGPSHESHTIGRVRIVYSTHGITLLMGEIREKFLILSFFIAFFGGLIFYFISRPMVREVRDLADGAHEVGMGNMSFRAKPGSLPETQKLSRAFNSMLDSLDSKGRKLEEANQRMLRSQTLAEVGKFSLMIAHEIKNPLGIIKSSFDLLRKDYNIEKNNKLAWFVEDEIRRINTLVEEFLSFARPSEPVFTRRNLNGMLQDILNRFQVMFAEREEVTTRVEIPMTSFHADVDESLLTRSITNLLKNAYEAVGEKGHMKVRATHLPDNGWQVTVSDTGPGIGDKDMDLIFEPFYTTKVKGTGLGLAFVKHAVAVHGGVVTAKNLPDGGAEFTLRLPRSPLGA